MIIASFVFMLLLAASTLLVSRATRQLTTEQKALVAENSSGSIGWLMVSIAALYGLQALIIHFIGYSRWLLLLFMAIIFVLATVFAVVQQRRLARLDLPAAYVRTQRIGMLLTHLGLLALFISIFYGPVQLLSR